MFGWLQSRAKSSPRSTSANLTCTKPHMPPPSPSPPNSSPNSSPLSLSHPARRTAVLLAAETNLVIHLQNLFHHPSHIHLPPITFATNILIREASVFRSNPSLHPHPLRQLCRLTRATSHCLDFLIRLPIPPSTNVPPQLFHHPSLFATVATQTIRAVSAFAHLRVTTLVPRLLRAFAHFIIAASTLPPRHLWAHSLNTVASLVAPALHFTLEHAPPAQRALIADAVSPLLGFIGHFVRKVPCLAEGEPPVMAKLAVGEVFVSAIGMVLYALPVEKRRMHMVRLVRVREAAVDAVGVEAQLCRDLDVVLQRVEDSDG